LQGYRQFLAILHDVELDEHSIFIDFIFFSGTTKITFYSSANRCNNRFKISIF
jgi:hypothetical protein